MSPPRKYLTKKSNAFYRRGTPEANAAVQSELEKPARDR